MPSAQLFATGMGDPSGELLPGETVVASVRRHPMALAAAAAETLGFIVLGYLIAQLFDTSRLALTLWGLLFLLSAVRVGVIVWQHRMERFVITDRRLMLSSGILTRRFPQTPLRRITDFTYELPALGRIFGYCTFVVESAGQDQALSRVAYLPFPDELYGELTALLYTHARQPDDGSGSDSPVSSDGSPSPGKIVAIGRRDRPARLGGATPYLDLSDAPTGPIGRVMVNDQLGGQWRPDDREDEDDDGTGTDSGGPGRWADARTPPPDGNPVHESRRSRWSASRWRSRRRSAED